MAVMAVEVVAPICVRTLTLPLLGEGVGLSTHAHTEEDNAW